MEPRVFFPIVVTVGAILAVELARSAMVVPTPVAIVMIAVLYASYAGGRVAGTFSG
jgi:hypothetical protein